MSQDWRLDLLFLIHTQWPNLWGKGENKDLMPRLNWLNVSHLPDMGKNTTAFNPGLHIDESLTSPRPSPRAKIWRPVSMPSRSSRNTEIGSGKTACDLRLDRAGKDFFFVVIRNGWWRKICVYKCVYVYIYIYIVIHDNTRISKRLLSRSANCVISSNRRDGDPNWQTCFLFGLRPPTSSDQGLNHSLKDPLGSFWLREFEIKNQQYYGYQMLLVWGDWPSNISIP